MKSLSFIFSFFLVLANAHSEISSGLMNLETITARCKASAKNKIPIPFEVAVFQSNPQMLALEKDYLLTIRRISNIPLGDILTFRDFGLDAKLGSPLYFSSLTFENDPNKRLRIFGFDAQAKDLRYFGIRKLRSGRVNDETKSFSNLVYSLKPVGISLTEFSMIGQLNGKPVTVHDCSTYSDENEVPSKQIDFHESGTYYVGAKYSSLVNLMDPLLRMLYRSYQEKILATNNGASIYCTSEKGIYVAPRAKVAKASVSLRVGGNGDILEFGLFSTSASFTPGLFPSVVQDKNGVWLAFSSGGRIPENVAANEFLYSRALVNAAKPSGNKFSLFNDFRINAASSIDLETFGGSGSLIQKSSYKFKFIPTDCRYF